MIDGVYSQNFDKYMQDSFKFQGLMNGMANSIELMLEVILERNKAKCKDGITLGTKIGLLEKQKDFIKPRFSGDFDLLIGKIRTFNKNWTITKHGMVVAGLTELTFHKNNQFHSFSDETQSKIKNEFSEIMSNLIEISKIS